MEPVKYERILHTLNMIVILLFGIAAISLSLNQNIWTDEAFTMQLLSGDFTGIISGPAADVHPPLYYLLGKLAQILFGNSLFVQKMVVICPVLLLMIYSSLYISRLFGVLTSFIYNLSLVAWPVMLEYSVQVRMYTWAILFVTICGVTAYEIQKNPNKIKWIIFVLSGVAAAYTHYFAFVSIVFLYAYLFLYLLIKQRKQCIRFIVALVSSIILYLPWLAVLQKQASTVMKGYNVDTITFKIIISYFTWMFETSTPYSSLLFGSLIIFSAIVLVYDAIHKKDTDAWVGLKFISIPILTLISGLIVSFMITPIFRERYLIPSMGLFLLGIAIAIGRLGLPICFLLSIFLTAQFSVQYQDTYTLEYEIAKTDQTMEFFEEHIGPDDLILYNYTGYGFVYEYYLPENTMMYLADMDFNSDFTTIWYLDTYNYYPFKEKILENYKLKKEFFGNFGIEQNEFKIYKLTRIEGQR